MLHSARLLWNEIAVKVQQLLQENEGFSLVLTGHSLGAGVASLCTMLIHEGSLHGTAIVAQEWWWWHARVNDTVAVVELPAIPIHCHAYACPCTVSPDLSVAYEHIITSYVLENDIVPRLSLGSIYSLRAEAKERVKLAGSTNLSRLLRATGVDRFMPSLPFVGRLESRESDQRRHANRSSVTIDLRSGLVRASDQEKPVDNLSLSSPAALTASSERANETPQGKATDSGATESLSARATSSPCCLPTSPPPPPPPLESPPPPPPPLVLPISTISEEAAATAAKEVLHGSSSSSSGSGESNTTSSINDTTTTTSNNNQQQPQRNELFAYRCNLQHLHYFTEDRLVPPGTIMHFLRDENGVMLLERSCFGNFSDILIAPGMFWSHLPSQYESAFGAIMHFEKRKRAKERKPTAAASSDSLEGS